jgi:hypothetical protein
VLPFARSSRPAAAPPPPLYEEHHSRAFPQLVGSFGERDRPVLLDLGPAWGDNLAFWRGRVSKLVFADLWEAAAGGFRPTAPQLVAVMREAVGWLDGRPPSAVLAWDLLDHLGREEISAVARVLAEAAAPGTRLLAMVSARGTVPDAPRLFRIAGSGVLRYEPAPAVRTPPHYKEPELCRLLTGFRVEATHLLRNGEQEYVFVYDPPGAAAALATMRANGGAPASDAARSAARAATSPPAAARSAGGAPEPAPASRLVSPSAEPSRIRPSFVPPRRIELPRPKNPKLPPR